LIETTPGEWTDAELTVREFRLLVTLARERGRVLSRDELQQRVWGSPHRPRDRIVDVCVRKLREKLDMRSSSYSFIQTHYGVGYRFEPEAKS
jgi:DNA-binding response OmpR family regulator